MIGSKHCISLPTLTSTVWILSRRLTSKRYTDTLNLPKTAFPLSMKDGVANKRELEIQKTSNFSDLYSWQQQDDRTKHFVLHDGPPYANGKPHVGHALNKILKDITNRYKVLQGYKVHYVAGWDCHGMPIEQKALAEVKADHTMLDPLDIRHKAKKYAQKAIKGQRKAFQRWGVMADWSQGYYTYDKEYVVNQLQVFHHMYKQGLIYRDYMPVHWSPSARTALAEAELEYKEDHISPSVFVKFPLVSLPNHMASKLGDGRTCYVVIWTTTPWTLPANKAVCYGSGIRYCLAKCFRTGDIFLICKDFKERLSQIMGTELEILHEMEGADLEGTKYCHPLVPGAELPLLSANHVTVAKGTGLVHTAPAHGQEDFQVAVNHGLPLDCLVNEDGVYRGEAGPLLEGKHVLQAGNDTVLELLGEHVVHREQLQHSYPYDWRTKLPVIMRASQQWFVNTASIKNKALECLQHISISPESSGKGMLSQLDHRTYWCISRQRSWGVPIPVFYHRESGETLLTKQSVDNVCNRILEHGVDCWWTLPETQLLPDQADSAEYNKGTDVLDIWFDSGCSWATVLKDCGCVADVYLEGLDQFGGWFQSSLLTSVAVNGKPPYKSLVVHGFTMDEHGRKMSKSVGNVVDPHTVVAGSKDEASFGADVLRWWAAQAHLDSKVTIGPGILQNCNEQIFKVRKSVRYLMGNLCDFQPSKDSVAYHDMLPQDKYMLHQLHRFCTQVTHAYDNFHFDWVLSLVEKFNNVHVSSFHSHISKDRMYCGSKHGLGRRSGQTVQYLILTALAHAVAPIVPHLAEEMCQHHPLKKTGSIFKSQWFEAVPEWHSEEICHTFDVVLAIKETFNGSIACEDPSNFDTVICAQPNIFAELKKLQPEMTSSTSSLCEVMQSSQTSVLSRLPPVIPEESQPVDGTYPVLLPDGSKKQEKFLLLILPADKFMCERCRRYTTDRYNEPCPRCLDVMAEDWG